MATTMTSTETTSFNPIDVIEEIAAHNDWAHERQSDEELALRVTGAWCEYHLWFVWRSEIGALYFSCGLDMRVPKERREALYPLLAKLNERLWLGHFEIWSDEGWPTFRHTILVRDVHSVTIRIVEDLIDCGLAECERFYPAFQFVIWGGRSADEAIEAALLDTVGEA